MVYVLPKRAQKALSQEVRRRGQNVPLDELYTNLESLLNLCGESSQNRKNAIRVGLLLASAPTKVLVPVCPDYSHRNGVYTFESLGEGLSLLAQKHIGFLETVVPLMQGVQPVFLLADLESQDDALCRSVGLDKGEFDRRVRVSHAVTLDTVRHRGWECELMTTTMPDIAAREERARRWISESDVFRARIQTEAIQRSAMYEKICPRMSFDEKVLRTVRTAAQYVALGQFAAEHCYAVCNHSTTNLSWYLQTDVAVLHNNVSVY